MTTQKNGTDEWQFEAIQKRYKATDEFDLTLEQAKLIYFYEQDLNIPFSKHHFSYWEEKDYELVSFEKILTPSQFESYKTRREEQIKRHEANLVQHDKVYSNQVHVAEELLIYYQNELLPALEKQRVQILQAFSDDREKLDYLKAEYKKHLQGKKVFILSDHFRESRTFQPILLQLSLLNHQLTCLLPDYGGFLFEMDEPTKAVADYFETKVKRAAEMLYDILKQSFAELETFKQAMRTKYSDEAKGWHFSVTDSELRMRVILIMQAILADRKKFGC